MKYLAPYKSNNNQYTYIMKSDPVETSAARFWVDKDNIFHAEYKDIDSIQLEDSMNEFEACKSMNELLPVLSIVDISSVRSVSSEARDLCSSDKIKIVYKAVALITKTPISKVLGNFFLGLNRPPVQVKLFNDSESAARWLKSLD